MRVEQNISRLEYLLSLYKMTKEELCALLNEGRKKLFTEKDIFSKTIDESVLKKIDKIFHKGLYFYLDPTNLSPSHDASIFFRKNVFGTELNMSARRIVTQFEDAKISLSAIAKLADVNIERTLPVYRISQSPQETALQIRQMLYPEKHTHNKKDFLKALIDKLAQKNILVCEFIERPQTKEKANIDGFFLNPNVIVLKRNQNSFNREIFTLVHELGHYLLNEEEIEQVDITNTVNLSAIERWCNDFAYYFLMGDYAVIIDSIGVANASNDYHHEQIEAIVKTVNISRIALYTRLLLQGEITPYNYNRVKADLDAQYNEWLQSKQTPKNKEQEDGQKRQFFAPATPINSPLLISTIQIAFYEGIINESDVCRTLNIRPNKLDKYIQ